MARWFFPRALAVIYLIAIASWAWQYRGLCGEGGIVPVGDLMAQLRAADQPGLFWRVPTLFWWADGDAFALGAMGVMMAVCLLIIAGVWQGPLLLVLWAGYLSLATTGDVFMGFQWDALLLEAGLLGALLAPWRWWAWRQCGEPPRAAIWLLRLLLFKLMLMSGVVKWWGGDPSWRDGTAMLYHYQTQPLPNGLSWWVHHLPRWAHLAGCWFMHLVELILPWAIFCGAWGRLAMFAGTTLLMGGVFISGNYNFFNLLTIALATALLQDRWWPRRLRQKLGAADVTQPRPWRSAREWPIALAAAPLAALSLMVADGELARRIEGWSDHVPQAVQETVLDRIAPFRSINGYGLFQQMTKERLEITLEVSDDGILWMPLSFRCKPGALDRRPPFIAPHQPRLDWQMWFAALHPGFIPQRDMADSRYGMVWFGRFLEALLQHRQAVWDLLEAPPFPVESIQHVRAQLHRYRYTTPEEHAQTGDWWAREYLGAYSPAFHGS